LGNERKTSATSEEKKQSQGRLAMRAESVPGMRRLFVHARELTIVRHL
jgi:hypothetical protein